MIAVAYFVIAGSITKSKHTEKVDKKSGAENTTRLVDLNSASQEELMRLPGIGPTLSKRIIDNRPYQKKADIFRQIPTLGIRRWRSIEPLVASLHGDEKEQALEALPKLVSPTNSPASKANTNRSITVRNNSDGIVALRIKSLYPFDPTSVSYFVKIAPNSEWTNSSEILYACDAYSIELVKNDTEFFDSDVVGAGANPISLEVQKLGTGGLKFKGKEKTLPKGTIEPMAFPSPVLLPFEVPKSSVTSMPILPSNPYVPVPYVEPRPSFPRPEKDTVFVNEIDSGNGELNVSNGTKQDAWVKLCKPGRDRSVLSFYVRCGSSLKLNAIASGSYELKFALGEGWDSKKMEMPYPVSAAKFDQLLNFSNSRTEYSVLSITLNPVSGGNAKTNEISLAEFLKN